MTSLKLWRSLISSPAQAARLHRVVKHGAQIFDRITKEMGQHDIDNDVTEAAKTIADI